VKRKTVGAILIAIGLFYNVWASYQAEYWAIGTLVARSIPQLIFFSFVITLLIVAGCYLLFRKK